MTPSDLGVCGRRFDGDGRACRDFREGRACRDRPPRAILVGREKRGRGLGKLQISVLAEVARALDVRLFCSVSPRNAASAAALKASAETRLLRTLDDGCELREFGPPDPRTPASP